MQFQCLIQCTVFLPYHASFPNRKLFPAKAHDLGTFIQYFISISSPVEVANDVVSEMTAENVDLDSQVKSGDTRSNGQTAVSYKTSLHGEQPPKKQHQSKNCMYEGHNIKMKTLEWDLAQQCTQELNITTREQKAVQVNLAKFHVSIDFFVFVRM